jgi:HK97 gp10 family phage protein
MANAIIGNFAQVEAALALVAVRVDAADEVVEETSARIVAAIAGQLAPTLSGHLAASVDEEGGAVVADTPYAGYQEWGTRHHKAQPFMRPAKDRAEVPARQSAERIYTTATR